MTSFAVFFGVCAAPLPQFVTMPIHEQGVRLRFTVPIGSKAAFLPVLHTNAVYDR
jgi:hypothetical protein